MPTRRSLLLLLAVVALCAPLVACGSETAAPEPPGSGASSSGELPTTIPVPDGEVTTQGPVTVLDDGNGPQLCLGGVMESYPPQCGGPALAGWEWADHDGDYEQATGTRWGDFVVTGNFDGDTFTVREVVPAAEYDAPASSDDDFETSCPEAGGDVCVTDAHVTEQELRRIQDAVTDAGVPGFLSSGSDGDAVELGVVHDDGSIRAWADDEFGEGRVVVRSALVAPGSG